MRFFVIFRHDIGWKRSTCIFECVLGHCYSLQWKLFCSEASNSCPIGNNESPFNRTKEHFQDIGWCNTPKLLLLQPWLISLCWRVKTTDVEFINKTSKRWQKTFPKNTFFPLLLSLIPLRGLSDCYSSEKHTMIPVIDCSSEWPRSVRMQANLPS